MLENISSYDEKRMLGILSEFQHATESHLELLQNLLSWAQMQTGKMKYKPVRFDAVELVKEVADIYALPMSNKGLKLNIQADRPCVVLADRPMIHTVLRNLINNAIKFSHPDSEIVLAIRCSESGADFTIRDSGTGMSSEQMDSVAQNRSGKSIPGTRGEMGSGLGLVICRDFLERNHSRLILKSDPENGTEAGFTLKL